MKLVSMRNLMVAFVAVSAGVAQTTVVLTADKDNTLYESPTGSLSNGAGSYLFGGVTGQPGIRRTLVHFNVRARCRRARGSSPRRCS
jgi:hypothetical protein